MGFISSLFGRGKKDTNPKVNITYPSCDAAGKGNNPERADANSRWRLFRQTARHNGMENR